ncbi:MAG: dTMP kinase [Fibrobacterales bacterium]
MARNLKNVMEHNISSRFFSLEGLDGCGKSTQIKLIEKKLIERGHAVTLIRDPGGTKVSEKIRELILDPDCSNMASKSELFLYSASRAQLIGEIIEPALNAGSIVLADRFGWSTYAYQGFGRGLDAKEIETLLKITCGSIWPEQTFILDIPVEVFRARSDKDNRVPDRIEKEAGEFFERVRAGYQDVARKNPENVTLLDGTQEMLALNEAIVEKIIASL